VKGFLGALARKQAGSFAFGGRLREGLTKIDDSSDKLFQICLSELWQSKLRKGEYESGN